MTESTDAPPPQPPATPARNPGGCRAVALPLMILGGMAGIIATACVIYLALHPSVFVAAVLVEQIGRTSLPGEQKQRITTMVGEVERRYADGELTRQQVDAIGREIGSDPAINAALFYHVARIAIERDGLATPASAPGTSTADDLRLLQRLVRGIAEGSIDGKIINDLAPLISDAGRPKRAGKIKQDDYTTMMTRARETVNEADVPSEPYEVDAAMLFEQAIKRGEAQ